MTLPPTAPDATRAAADDGFTLVELLVSMTLAIVLLLAILGASDLFRSTSQAATELSVAQDNARAVLRQMTDTLRQAVPAGATTTPVARIAGRNDLVVAAYVPDASGHEQPGWVRYCTADHGRSLLRGVRIGGSGADAGACGTDPASGWVYGAVIHGTLRGAGTLFAYSSADCFGACTLDAPAVRTVGIRLEVATDPDGDRTTVLRGAVSLRNRSDPAPA